MTAGGSVAVCVCWSEVACPVLVFVVEVPVVACGDWLAASAAGDGVVGYTPGPLEACSLVVCAVAALCGGASSGLVFDLVLRAVAVASLNEVWAARGWATTHRHLLVVDAVVASWPVCRYTKGESPMRTAHLVFWVHWIPDLPGL